VCRHEEATTLLDRGPHGLLTVRYLRASGSNRHLGQVMASAALAVHGADAGPHAAPDPTVQRARQHWFSIHHAVLSERMRGIGDVFGVDPCDEQWDLGRLGPTETSPGCSAVFHPGHRTATGHALLGRNFDFPTGTYNEITGSPARTGERPLAADVCDRALPRQRLRHDRGGHHGHARWHGRTQRSGACGHPPGR
jgi:hypothetical protein